MSSLSPDNLKRAILEVIVYFDLFAYPPTTLEVWRNLRVEVSAQEVWSALQSSEWLKERVGCRDGMWFLKGRDGQEGKEGQEGVVHERRSRYRASKHKLDRAKQFVHLVRWIPGVQAVYACNSLGFLHSRAESDIDLFIVSRRGRIWSTRFFAVLLAKLFFSRPSGAHARDALCLSFFAVDGADLQKVALPGGDVYYEHWLKNLLPLYEKGKREKKEKKGKMGDMVETLLKRVQLQIMPAHLKAMANQGTSVVLSDEFLKFHDHDKREYYHSEFNKRLAAVTA